MRPKGANLLYSPEVNKNISKLDDAWKNDETFVFLPERSGVSEDWIRIGMERFPKKYHRGHFALLTSGSTGMPKLILASKQRAERLVQVIHQLQDGEPAEQTILVLPLSYCYAFVNQWLWSRVFNRKLIYTEGFSQPVEIKERLLAAKNAMMCLVYPQVPLLFKYFGAELNFPGLIRLHFAGGPFPQNDIDKVHHLFPNAKVFNNYGCAEAMPRLTIRREEESHEGSNIGKALPGIEMKVDEDDRILFRSPYSAVGFYDDNGFVEVTADMWIPSGDLGEQMDGGYWRIKGRANEVFKRFGEKISLPQLLKTVCTAWKGEATFYREKEPSGEEGHVLVLCPQPTEEQFRTVLAVIRRHHPRAQWPIRLESVSRIPLSVNNKVDKFALSQMTDRITHWHQRSANYDQ
jgi:acyl-CoA synthetase (AMP-forming)/AMP-acid ligase II